MAASAWCNVEAKETRPSDDDVIGIDMLEKNLKREHEEFVDVGEEGDVNTCRVEKKEKLGRAGEAEEKNTVFSVRSTGFGASDDDSGTANEAKATDAQNVQAEPGVPPQHWWQLPFDCNHCGLAVKSVAEFDQHDSVHKQEREQQKQQQQRPIWCLECRQSFQSIADRDRHLRTSPRHFCCRYCENLCAFSNDDSLRSHYNTFHHEIYCELCDLHFANTIQYHSHFEAGHGSCAVCRKLFSAFDLCDKRCRTCHVKFIAEMSCPYCDRHFANRFEKLDHLTARHRFCSVCHKPFSEPDLFDKRCRTCHAKTRGTESPTSIRSEKGPPDHYARLGISRNSTQEQVVKAAKEMRVKMHPDRRKRGLNGLRLSGQEMRIIDEEAALVGMAADILSDPDLRLKYDCKMFRR